MTITQLIQQLQELEKIHGGDTEVLMDLDVGDAITPLKTLEFWPNPAGMQGIVLGS